VTLTFDFLTLVSDHTWRVTWSIHRPSLKILTAIRSWVMSSDISHRIPSTMRLQPLRMRRITWPMHRWQIFPAYLKSLIPICLFTNTTFMALRLRQMELSIKTVHGPVLKITQLSVHALIHVSIERCHKSFTTIILGDHNFPLTASNFGNLTAFRAIFSHIFTAHAQKPLFMNLRLKFWHHHSIPWLWFPYKAWYFRDLRTFSVDFCIG